MECSSVEITDYGVFSGRLHQRGASQHLPLNGTIEVTERCNLRCAHCYVPMPARQGAQDYDPVVPRQESAEVLNDRAMPRGATARQSNCGPTCQPSLLTESRAKLTESRAKLTESRAKLAESRANHRSELRFEDICQLLDEIASEGCLWLLITGGEPLMRPEFLEIYRYAKHKGFLITLFTNGTLITEKIAAFLATHTPFVVEISVYGATKDTYEAVTGVAGSYERCLQGIDLLVAQKIPLRLKTLALRPNAHDLVDMERLARERGLGFRWDALVHPTLDGCGGPKSVRLTPGAIVALDLADPRRVAAWNDVLETTHGLHRGDRLFSCGAGDGMFHIDSFGFLQLCGFARRYNYDLREGSFKDGYWRYFPFVRGLHREKNTLCDSCDLFNVCGICPAWEEMENDGQEGPIQFVHEYATRLASHLRGQSNAQNDTLNGSQIVSNK